MMWRGEVGGGCLTYTLEVHSLHCLVHTLDHTRHVPSYLPHRHGSLDSACDCVESAS